MHLHRQPAVLLGITAVGSAVSTWGGLRWLRESVRADIFPAPLPAGPLLVPSGFELLRAPGPDPVSVLYAAPPAGAATVVFFHGNAMDLESSTEILLGLRDAGFGAAAVEYVGYGPHSTAKASESGIADACGHALDTLVGRPEVRAVILLGFSLGSAFATAMAARGYGQTLIIAAGFTSGHRVSRAAVRWVPPRIFLGDQAFDNLGKATLIDLPTLVIHGENDEAIPIDMGRELAQAFPQGHFLAVPHVDHNGMSEHMVTAVKIAVTDSQTWPARWP